MIPPESIRSLVEGASNRESPSQPAAQELYDLRRFTLADMVRCGVALRALVSKSGSVEEAARRTTRYLYEVLRNKPSGTRSCLLVRLFVTRRYDRLGAELQQVARSAGLSPLAEDTKCFVLLGSCGDDPRWNDRRKSQAHQCIPLQSETEIARYPMIAQSIRQLGVPMSALLKPAPELVKDLERKSFGVFHVEMAEGSPFVPAQQDFVIPYGVQSALGFGGSQPDGELFVVVIFSRVAIPPSIAELFQTIALSIKLGLLGLLDKPFFAD